MTNIKKSKRKPLSFSTTMRNPDRIAGFLSKLLPYENEVLTNEVIDKIIKSIIKDKLYKPMYISRNQNLREIYYSDDLNFSENQIIEIINNSPQNHKQAGFDKGWPSRFETWYQLAKEFGFTNYAIGKPLKISTTGHMLIDAYMEDEVNEKKIQEVFLNALMKYQSDNPFKRNANSNVPLLLLLNTIKLLKDDPEENDAGIFRKELSILICWEDSNAEEVYKKIKEIRNEVGYNYSDEYMYDKCLEILGLYTAEEKEAHKKYFKMEKICGEAVDEYIRKMRSTGIISLRGGGRFLDINSFEKKKINYILNNYSIYPKFEDKNEYYEYMGEVDNNILSIIEDVTEDDKLTIRTKTLYEFAEKYQPKEIFKELDILATRKESKDEIFKFISAPIRLEFLTSIALVQNIPNVIVQPNYSIDDEGLPTMTAGGNEPDIVCVGDNYDSLVEVTLMCGRSDQVNNEIIPIRRHLLESKKINQNSFSMLIAPYIHEDTRESAEWYKYKEKLDIKTLTINTFINYLEKKYTLENFLKS